MQDLIKTTFGDEYSPSLTLPNQTYVDLVMVEGPNQHLVCKNSLVRTLHKHREILLKDANNGLICDI